MESEDEAEERVLTRADCHKVTIVGKVRKESEEEQVRLTPSTRACGSLYLAGGTPDACRVRARTELQK